MIATQLKNICLLMRTHLIFQSLKTRIATSCSSICGASFLSFSKCGLLLPPVDVAGSRSAQLNPSGVQAVWMLLDTPQEASHFIHARWCCIMRTQMKDTRVVIQKPSRLYVPPVRKRFDFGAKFHENHTADSLILLSLHLNHPPPNHLTCLYPS